MDIFTKLFIVKTLCEFIFYQYAKIFLTKLQPSGYILSIFLKFRHSQPQHSYKKRFLQKKNSVFNIH